MGYTFEESLQKQLQKDLAFRKEWEESAPEREIRHEIARGRARKCLTQKELSKLTKINQSNLSRIESGEVRTIERAINEKENYSESLQNTERFH